jgi:hypothetical protein
MQIKENRVKKIENRLEKRQISKLKGFVIILFSIFYSLPSQAQCAMCRASLESEGNTMKAEAVNDGIVYLMVIPYVLVGIVGLVVYRMYTKKKTQ